MFQVIFKFTRPNTEVEFYTPVGNEPDKLAFRAHWKEKYTDTGLCTVSSAIDAANPRIMFRTFTWKTEQDWKNSLNDQVVTDNNDRRAKYNAENKITVSRTNKTVA